MYLPKANPTKQAEMEKLRKRLLSENTATLKSQPIDYNARPWQEHMRKGGGKSSQPDLHEQSSPKVKEEHRKIMNYLSERRNLRLEAQKNGHGSDAEGYATTGNEKHKKPVNDAGLSKILKDKNISEFERMEAVRLRAE